VDLEVFRGSRKDTTARTETDFFSRRNVFLFRSRSSVSALLTMGSQSIFVNTLAMEVFRSSRKFALTRIAVLQSVRRDRVIKGKSLLKKAMGV
jgi:hypothetical protein